MPLFRIANHQTLELVPSREFTCEKELHHLLELNLINAMGIKLVASEYPVPNGRIDSLAIDEDGIPVIIEYKWRKDPGAIVQGLFYMDWILKNRKPFESIIKDKIGKEVDVNWSSNPRLIIVAQDFDVKELAAINQLVPTVELKKYALYDGLFWIEDVNIVKAGKGTSDGEIGKGQDAGNDSQATLAALIAKVPKDVADIFWQIRKKILELSGSVREKPSSQYCDYRTVSTFVTIYPQKERLRILIKMGNQKANDPKGICTPVPKSYGFGYLNTQFVIAKKDEVEYALDLIKQAFHFVTG